MTFFVLLLGNLVKGFRDGNGGGTPLKQYNSKDIGNDRWARRLSEYLIKPQYLSSLDS
jgi:hypothetical protein